MREGGEEGRATRLLLVSHIAKQRKAKNESYVLAGKTAPQTQAGGGPTHGLEVLTII